MLASTAILPSPVGIELDRDPITTKKEEQMSLKRFLLALTGMALLAVAFANTAMGASAIEEGRYTVNGTKRSAPFTEKVKCSAGEHEGSSALTLTGAIGEGGEIPVKLTATTVECVNHEGTVGANGTSEIVQTGTATPNFLAEAIGRLKFSGFKVDEPAHCKVVETSIVTTPLKGTLYMDTAATTISFIKFEPTNTTTKLFAEPEFATDGTGACSIAGKRPVKGFTFGQATNATGTFAVNQPLTFSTAIDTTAGSALTFGGNPAHLTGRVNNELAGTNAGTTYGATKN